MKNKPMFHQVLNQYLIYSIISELIIFLLYCSEKYLFLGHQKETSFEALIIVTSSITFSWCSTVLWYKDQIKKLN